MKKSHKSFLGGMLIGSLSSFFLVSHNKNRLSKIKKDVMESADLYQKVTSDWNKVNQKAFEVSQLIQERVPEYIDDLNKQIRAYKFQIDPRLKLINERANRIQSKLTTDSKSK